MDSCVDASAIFIAFARREESTDSIEDIAETLGSNADSGVIELVKAVGEK